MSDTAEIAMLNNVRAGLRHALSDELETERKAAMKEMDESVGTILDIIREPNMFKAVSTSLQRIDKARTGSPGP
jgi:cytochrome c556